MSIETHLESLEEKHLQLKQQIAQEMNHPSPNLVLITNLKKQKLVIKEEIQHLMLSLGNKEAASSA